MPYLCERCKLVYMVDGIRCDLCNYKLKQISDEEVKKLGSEYWSDLHICAVKKAQSMMKH